MRRMHANKLFVALAACAAVLMSAGIAWGVMSTAPDNTLNQFRDVRRTGDVQKHPLPTIPDSPAP